MNIFMLIGHMCNKMLMYFHILQTPQALIEIQIIDEIEVKKEIIRILSLNEDLLNFFCCSGLFSRIRFVMAILY